MRASRRLTALLAAAAALVGGVILPAAQAVSAPSGSCAAIIGITARGSTEPQGGGSLAGPLVASIAAASRQTVAQIDLVYPADLLNYQSSEKTGVANLTSLLKTTAAKCPTSRFLLVGWSQGAAVIGDVLAAAKVPAAPRIRAAVLYGDPNFNSAEPFDTGGFKPGVNGIFARPTGQLTRFASRLRSVCHADDNFCQAGVIGLGHFTYGTDRSAATSFVLNKIGG